MSADSFTKLSSGILASTVWQEPSSTRIVWITMLALADRNGYVAASIPGLAHLARVSIPEAETALAAFSAPDPYSRTPDHEGRRIEAVAGGWRLLNHGAYRARRDADDRKDYQRDWDRHHRPSGHARSKASPIQSDSPTEIRQIRPNPTQAEAEAEADQKKDQKRKGAVAPLVVPDWLPAEVWGSWHAFRNARKGWTPHARALSLRTLTTLRAAGHDPQAVIEQSIERGWTGLFQVRPDFARKESTQPSRQMLAIHAAMGLTHEQATDTAALVLGGHQQRAVDDLRPEPARLSRR